MSTLIRPVLASYPSSFPSVSAYPVLPTSGLVGWYEFDDGTGTTLTDRSGLNNDGTLSGGPTWGAEGLTFDGVDDWVTTTVAGTAEFDWVVLFKPASGGPANQRLMGDSATVASFNTGAIAYILDGTDTFRLVASRSDGTTTTSNVTGAVADLWYIVSYSRYGSGTAARQRVTVDGGLFDDDSMVTGNGTAGNVIRFGDTFQQSATERFKGTIAAALLYNRGLTPDERIEAVRYLKLLAAQRSITVS